MNRKYAISLFALLVPFASAVSAQAQLNSNAPTISLSAVLPETLSISATPSAVTFALNAGGTSTASAPIVITTSWILAAARGAITVNAYFANPTAALTGGTPVVNIPSSAVLGMVSTGTPTAFTPFTQTTATGVASAGLTLFSQTLSALNRNANRSDSMMLELNLSSLPQLPSGSYTGSLIIQAQAL